MISENMKVIKCGKLKWREEYDFYTLYNFNTDDLFRVPKAAIDILEYVDGNNTAKQIIDNVIEKNGYSNEVYQKLFEYMKLLEKKEIIKMVE